MQLGLKNAYYNVITNVLLCHYAIELFYIYPQKFRNLENSINPVVIPILVTQMLLLV